MYLSLITRNFGCHIFPEYLCLYLKPELGFYKIDQRIGNQKTAFGVSVCLKSISLITILFIIATLLN